LDFLIKLADVKAIEIRDAINAQQHGLPVDHKGTASIPECGLNDQRVAIAPVVAVAGE
jgi:hypothetical protein